MTTDDGVTSESALVNVRLLSRSVLQQIFRFFDSDIVMLAVHSRQVHLVRFSRESYARRDCVSATLYGLAVSP